MSKLIREALAFVALFPVRVGHDTFRPGERLELTEDQAARLLAQKIVTPVPVEAVTLAEAVTPSSAGADEGQAPETAGESQPAPTKTKTNAKTQGSKA